MKQLMIATSNAHKVNEFEALLKPLGYEVKSLLDLAEPLEIEENGSTFEENALIKASAVHKIVKMPVIADDSGLCVNAMDGAPGIYSARFMGYDTDYDIKNREILAQVQNSEDKGAQFVCAIAYVESETLQHVFTGVVEGKIHDQMLGEHGFGYDPIFYYPPFHTTLANVSESLKNEVSHRSRACAKLIAYLEDQ